MSISKNIWNIRAIQLDLARQKETLETIESFMRFARDWGYNAVFLYLEGIVQTPSFPYRKAKDSYTVEEIQTLLGKASEMGLEVIPGLATLGHAEHFLDCPELEHLRETGFWYQHMFCPSHPGTYEFLEPYLKEIADLFPSENFHIGCDEAWALGACPVCRQRIQNGESREELFIQHVLRMHRFLGALGKRTWIWPDLFETFSDEALNRLPKDIVLCSWHYEADQISRDGIRGHFNNLRRRDTLTEQAEAGFDVLICPWGRDINSGIALTEVTRGKHFLGGLLTNWELDKGFLPGVLPAAAVIGRLWSHPDESNEQVLNVVFEKLFPNAGEMEKSTVRHMLLGISGRMFFFHEILRRGALNLDEKRHLNTSEGSALILEGYLKRLPGGLEFDMVEEFLVQIRWWICVWKIRSHLAEIIDPRTSPETQARFSGAALAETQILKELNDLRAEQWRRHRPGIENDRAGNWIRTLVSETEDFVSGWTHASMREKCLLSIRLFLLEGYSAPRLDIALKGNTGWVTVFKGTFKPVNLKESSYLLHVPLFWKESPPDAIRIAVSGYGGQGIQFAQLVLNGRKWTPRRIVAKEGKIRDADALLNDDAFVCFLGEKDTLKTLETFTHDEESAVEVQLG